MRTDKHGVSALNYQHCVLIKKIEPQHRSLVFCGRATDLVHRTEGSCLLSLNTMETKR